MYLLEYFDVEEPRRRYTVTSALPGPHAQIEDVMLVQHYLNKIFEKNSGFPDRAPLGVDGKFGPRTASWVRAYQKWHRSNGDLIATDGKVSPAFDSSTPGGIAKLQSGQTPKGLWYTIVWMGWDYFAATGERDVARDTTAPALLRAHAAGARDADNPPIYL